MKTQKQNILRRLTWTQYRLMLNKATLMYEAHPDLEWKHRWGMVQLRIMQAMSNPVIFFRHD